MSPRSSSPITSFRLLAILAAILLALAASAPPSRAAPSAGTNVHDAA